MAKLCKGNYYMISNFETFMKARNLKRVKLKLIVSKEKQEILEYNIKLYIEHITEDFHNFMHENSPDSKDLKDYTAGIISIVLYINANVCSGIVKINVTEHFFQFLGQALIKKSDEAILDIDKLINVNRAWPMILIPFATLKKHFIYHQIFQEFICVCDYYLPGLFEASSHYSSLEDNFLNIDREVEIDPSDLDAPSIVASKLLENDLY